VPVAAEQFGVNRPDWRGKTRAVTIDKWRVGRLLTPLVTSSKIKAVGLVLALACASGCNLRELLVSATADATREAVAVVGPAQWDLELVERTLAGGVIATEGAAVFAPEYEPLLMSVVEGYFGYGQGFLKEEAHAAELAGDFDKAERLQRRAGLMFDHALLYSKRIMRLRDAGFDAAVGGGLDAYEEWLKAQFFVAEDDAEVLLVVGTSWFLTLTGSEDGLAATVDLPFAQATVQRSIELDPTLSGRRGETILGVVKCAIPEMMGGKPAEGMADLERVAEATNRENHGVLVAQAELCATALQDRAKFHATLMEVIQAGDVPDQRLYNKIARARAGRLLSQINELFF